MTFKKVLSIGICLFLLLNAKAQQNMHFAYHKSAMAELEMQMMEKTFHHEHPSADIYDDWNNVSVHAKTQNIPKNYRIDLRDFSMPIKHNLITSNFGYRPRFKRNHYGVDIKANVGDTVHAAFSGKVRVVKTSSGGYGKVIVIRHYNGLETVYGHLSKQIVKVNEHVESGQVIGLAGNTGRSTGPHLHFETRICGLALNPAHLIVFNRRDIVSPFYVFKH